MMVGKRSLISRSHSQKLPNPNILKNDEAQNTLFISGLGARWTPDTLDRTLSCRRLWILNTWVVNPKRGRSGFGAIRHQVVADFWSFNPQTNKNRYSMNWRTELKSFFHRIIIGDEKWIHYDNVDQNKKRGKPAMHKCRQRSQISISQILCDLVGSDVCGLLRTNVI